MKIRTFYEVINGKYYATLHTEDWSEQDQNLIDKFGEPEINVGGTYTVLPAFNNIVTEDIACTITVEDENKTWTPAELVGMSITNMTTGDVAAGTITANGTNDLDITLAQGKCFAPDDEYIIPRPAEPGKVASESTPVGGVVTITVTEANDDAKAWTTDEWVGYTLANNTRWGAGVILTNTATTLDILIDEDDRVGGRGEFLLNDLISINRNIYGAIGTTICNPVTIVDSTAAWEVDEWKDRILMNGDSVGTILSNTATTITAQFLTCADWLNTNPYIIQAEQFTHDDRYQKIKTESPFTQVYDSRDYPEATPLYMFANAPSMATTWGAAIIIKLQAAVAALRANEEDFNREEVTNV